VKLRPPPLLRPVRLIFLLLAAMGCLAAGAQAAEPTQPAQPAWTDHAPDPALVNRAAIGVPREAGSLKMKEVRDYGHDGIDDVAQYASADEAISGKLTGQGQKIRLRCGEANT
jgi:hypothetical protein